MDIHTDAMLAGLTIVDQYYHCKESCGCKVCSLQRYYDFIPADRTLYVELTTHKIRKCSKKACKKFGCECEFT